MKQIDRIRKALKQAHDYLPGIETPMMKGDNLAILICTIFDDGDDDDTGWSKSANIGYKETITAIRDHYDNLIEKALKEIENDQGRSQESLA